MAGLSWWRVALHGKDGEKTVRHHGGLPERRGRKAVGQVGTFFVVPSPPSHRRAFTHGTGGHLQDVIGIGIFRCRQQTKNSGRHAVTMNRLAARALLMVQHQRAARVGTARQQGVRTLNRGGHHHQTRKNFCAAQEISEKAKHRHGLFPLKQDAELVFHARKLEALQFIVKLPARMTLPLNVSRSLARPLLGTVPETKDR